MAYEIEHRFEELALLTDQGVRAGLVDGRAVISISPINRRDWSIDAIYLDGYRDARHAEAEVKNLPGTSEGAIYNIIFNALTTGTHADSIQDHVNEWLAGASARRADHVREIA
jgi:hypothetical protein